MEQVSTYFPGLSQTQLSQFQQLLPLYKEWNDKINVVSRKDIDQLNVRHVLHSLAIAKIISFKPGSKIVDIGTGGGFPGIPLAIFFPTVHFHLVDSIGKKIKVVEEIAFALNLKNVTAEKSRAEDLKGSYDFVVSRAVTALPQFYNWTKHLISKEHKNEIANGIIYIKGGDLNNELSQIPLKNKTYSIDKFYPNDFFQTKKVVHLFS